MIQFPHPTGAVGEAGEAEGAPARLVVEAVEEEPGVADQEQADDAEDEVVDVDAVDDDAAVGAGAVVVEEGGNPAGGGEREQEAEGGEHRPFAARAEVVVEVEALLELGFHLVDAVRPPGQGCDPRSSSGQIRAPEPRALYLLLARARV
jgi:hypothetical protein